MTPTAACRRWRADSAAAADSPWPTPRCSSRPPTHCLPGATATVWRGGPRMMRTVASPRSQAARRRLRCSRWALAIPVGSIRSRAWTMPWHLRRRPASAMTSTIVLTRSCAARTGRISPGTLWASTRRRCATVRPSSTRASVTATGCGRSRERPPARWPTGASNDGGRRVGGSRREPDRRSPLAQDARRASTAPIRGLADAWRCRPRPAGPRSIRCCVLHPPLLRSCRRGCDRCA